MADLNKIKILCNNIIHTKKYLLSVLMDNINKIRFSKYTLNDNYTLKNIYRKISSITFQELNAYCFYGYHLSDIYIINKFVNENKEEFHRKINNCDCLDNRLYYILFLTNEELYNKLFRNILNKSRDELFNELLFMEHKNYIYKREYNFNYENFINKINLKNINFNGDLFLDFQNIFYYLIFNFNFNDNLKFNLLSDILEIFENILYGIIEIIFLPLFFITNNLTFEIYTLCPIYIYNKFISFNIFNYDDVITCIINEYKDDEEFKEYYLNNILLID